MDALDQYLQGSLPVDQRELADLEKLIGQVGRTLVKHFDEATAWPHRIAREPDPKADRQLSHFSTVLITVTLWKLLDMWGRPAWRGFAEKFPPPAVNDELFESLREQAWKATNLLLKEIKPDPASAAKTRSETYGENDPFTLSYLIELASVEGEIDGQSIHKQVDDSIGNFIRKQRDDLYERIVPSAAALLEVASADGSSATASAIWEHKLLYGDNRPAARIISNAMIALRVAQTLRSRECGLQGSAATFRGYFEATLHQQLSYSSIPDSRFDPAELAFSLEGLLVVQKNVVDRTLFARVMDVLRNAQGNSAFWRPVRPFLATDKGMALFPVSVEVANSLIRSCEIFDGLSLHGTFSSECVPMFHRYFQWLQARTVRLDGKGEAIGWHSEHVNETGAIHSWETSLVLEFLVDYRRLLQAHMARQLLVLSRISVLDPRDNPDLEENNRSKGKPRAEAAELLDKLFDAEPVSCLGDHYKIFNRVKDDFGEPWMNAKPTNYSMLLFGPPGTGKTTIAQNLSKALRCRLVTVTVSDFLTEGDAELEARAKAIFSVLAAQPVCVVLFDEIDHFLLDRESRRYRDQLTTFQFMTPGMLTKIQNLRSSRRVIFIIATNYENRIDSAIKRTGRIDQHYLLLPPDGEARIVLINNEIGSINLERKKVGKDLLETVNDPGAVSRVESASIFLGRSDILKVVKQAAKAADPSKTFTADLIERLKSARRAASIGSYLQRMGDSQDVDHPFEELACMLGLAAELKTDFPNEHVSQDIGKLASDDTLRNLAWLGTKAPGLSPDMIKKILASSAAIAEFPQLRE